MRLHILNDLHIEFGDFSPPATDADVVVLAGDIGVGVKGLRWAAERFPDRPVIYVPGNHEFYHHDITLIDELRAAAPDHIHILDNDREIIDGLRILGATLWTDFALFGAADRLHAMRYAGQCMSDFAIIRNNRLCFTPKDALALHTVSRDWLAQMLAEPFDGQTIVVTHHAPSVSSIHPRYSGDLLSAAFASNLESLMGGGRAALWVHGHMHDSFDYEIHGTRVICNPRGYTPDALNPEFRADFVMEI